MARKLTGKDRVIAAASILFTFLFMLGGRVAARYVTFSISPSAGAHFFLRVRCPEKPARWQCVEVIPDPHDPFIPHPGEFHLVKHIGCLPGETVIRRGLVFWCRTRDGQLLFLGKTKLKAHDGRRLTPFTFAPRKEVTEYRLPGKSLFLVGDLQPHSYDSRYFGPVPDERVVSCLKPLF